jgi:hypothetical protein
MARLGRPVVVPGGSQSDAKVLPLVHYDLVVGMDWLA